MKPAAWRCLTNYHIKLLAAGLMVVDHVGYIFFPGESLFRIIGRLSFPLFAWLLVQGETHTGNFRRYAIRLLGLALITQPIYQLAFHTHTLNILFTLVLGLVCLRLARRYPPAALPIWVAAAVLAGAGHLDYGPYGIAVIALLSVYRTHAVWWAGWSALHLLVFATQPRYGAFQFPALAAPLLLSLTDGKPGAKARWFYVFYPAHLLVLYLLHRWL